jgi:hypothetical protein
MLTRFMKLVFASAQGVFLALCLAPGNAAAEHASIETRQGLRNALASESPEDHARVAEYYQRKAAECEANAGREEGLMAYFGKMQGMSTRNKPGPYQRAETMALRYRYEWRDALARASQHQRLARSQQAVSGESMSSGNRK